MSLFKKNQLEVKNKLADHIQEQRKEDLNDFILILDKILDAYNQEVGQDKEFKSYKARSKHIKNLIRLSTEQMNKKIMELG